LDFKYQGSTCLADKSDAVLKVRAMNDWNIWRCFACESVGRF
jgi:hypothetical protein